jgi:L-alanine-DL-glutamate epimerase-like enolase superfamily enzyme
MDIAAGEYGYELTYFLRLLESGAVDVLQADATRCAGITEFLRIGAMCEAFSIPLSTHTAPSMHLPLGCAIQPIVHLEYFHDHVRIEQMLFDGAIQPVQGLLTPDLSRPGLGLELRRSDARRYSAAA